MYADLILIEIKKKLIEMMRFNACIDRLSVYKFVQYFRLKIYYLFVMSLRIQVKQVSNKFYQISS